MTRVAAVARRKTHGEHTVLDVNLANSVDRSIVDACFPSPSMQVNAVETRAQARQREMEEQQLAKETSALRIPS